jgi:hypothetical protein
MRRSEVDLRVVGSLHTWNVAHGLLRVPDRAPRGGGDHAEPPVGDYSIVRADILSGKNFDPIEP